MCVCVCVCVYVCLAGYVRERDARHTQQMSWWFGVCVTTYRAVGVTTSI